MAEIHDDGLAVSSNECPLLAMTPVTSSDECPSLLSWCLGWKGRSGDGKDRQQALFGRIPGSNFHSSILGLAKLIGLAGETNVQGEEQKKLDVLSNEVFIKALVSSGRTCILVSEEDEEATFVEPSHRGSYCVVFDPLDGSSNIDCGVSIGTIFGIYLVKDNKEPTLDDVLQPGKNMVAAGYCMYGSSCMLVLSTGSGINGFTLDPSLGEFILTHPDIKIPKKGKIYSVNEGNAQNWDGPIAKYVEHKCGNILFSIRS
ncbi:Fructose-1,6-bisphosphatase, cytosolic [Sarracenia purpurea var. burkii]